MENKKMNLKFPPCTNRARLVLKLLVDWVHNRLDFSRDSLFGRMTGGYHVTREPNPESQKSKTKNNANLIATSSSNSLSLPFTLYSGS